VLAAFGSIAAGREFSPNARTFAQPLKDQTKMQSFFLTTVVVAQYVP